VRGEVLGLLYEKEIDRVIDPGIWRGIYAGFHRLDSYIVEAEIKEAQNGSTSESLLRMEEAKARTLLRVRALINHDQPIIELEERHATLGRRNEAAAAWTRQDPDRAVVSFFMGYRGLGIAALRNGQISQVWMDDFDEWAFIQQFFDPVPELVSRGFAGDALAFSAASTLVDSALAFVGEKMWQCMPDLTRGGSELLLIPHRLLRALPLGHARLPGGKRLSDVFQSVTEVAALCMPPVKDWTDDRQSVTGIGDANGDLLMARFEALKACRAGRCLTGKAATRAQLQGVLGGYGTVVVACHGAFNQTYPWGSTLFASDGSLSVFDLFLKQESLKADLIYLSACESGMNDVSLDDDPVGFAGLFSFTGARAVVAPLWKVDDFTAVLFADVFFREIELGTSPSRSTILASRELRGLSVKETLRRLARFHDELVEMEEQGRIESADSQLIDNRFSNLEQWLQSLPLTEKPFRRFLDWGAYQCHCNPFTNEEVINVR
jgi:hypothetical protein